MDKKTTKVIYETTDYSKFEKLEGNRSVKDSRVDKIIESINKIGYVTSPILVNEKLEVIDGQGRLAALERLRLPVEYIIQEGIGIDECQNMNIHQKNWTLHDYICSFAMLGNEHYARLQSLTDSFELPEGVIVAAASNRNYLGIDNSCNRKVKNGKFEISKKEYERVKWELAYAEKFQSAAKRVGGNKRPFYSAIIYAYKHLDSSGRNRLEDVIRQRTIELPALNNPKDYLKYFDAFYNQGLRKNKIHLAHQYEIDTE